MTFWMGACAGGVWRTTDGGRFWRPVSDGQLTSASIGAIAVAPSDPNVVWVGTGESQVRNNVVPGDGVYRTTDGGRVWHHLGLEPTRHIARVRVHPTDPDTAWVAALGDIFGPNPERGVYRTIDGGTTWERVLHVSDRAGAADLCLDPTNPRILYASTWEAVRRPWEMTSGGGGSALWRSADGGVTWEEVSARPGFAEGTLGRIGVAVSPARPDRVFALVEAGEDRGGLYRSDDAGTTWEHVSDHGGIQGRPWYYSHVFADPRDPHTVWSLNLWAWRSTDGGRHWTQIQTPHGDNHDLWIDPRDPRRMITGNDGGACTSFDGGMTWSTIYNQPTAQVYRFDVNPDFPHDLYATQQDNSGIRVPSRSWKGAIRWPDCTELGEAEAGDVALDPRDPRFVFLGGAGFGHPGPLLRFDTITEQAQDVAVWPEYFMGIGAVEHRYRFGWTYPITFSPHDPSCLYVGGERVFRSFDRGMTWEAISPDLTRDDAAKQASSGGPISKDTSGAEVYCTIHAFAESALNPGELWVGTDDGLVHLSRDGGANWNDITPPQLPEWATVQRIEPSQHRPGTAYLAAHAYRVQDRRPFLLRTDDHGATWELVVEGIPDDEWTRTIREDPQVPALLYAGTEHRPWASTDRGDAWFPIAANLPDVPIYDLQVRDHELIAGTHGRGLWILDDVTPLRHLPVELATDDLLVLPPPLARRYPTPTGFDMPGEGVWIGGFPGVPLGGAAFKPEVQPDGTRRNVVIWGGTNPPDGAAIRFLVGADLARDHGTHAVLRVTDGDGRELRAVHATPPEDHPEEPRPLRIEQGLNLFTWDLRIDGVVGHAGEDGDPSLLLSGPRVPPGTYRVELSLGDVTAQTTVEVARDPRAYGDEDDLAAQYAYLVRVRDLVERIQRAVERSRSIRAGLAVWTRPALPEDIREEAGELAASLEAVERLLANPDVRSHGDELKLAAGLDKKLILLPEIVVELSDTRPTSGAEEVLDLLAAQVEAALGDLDQLIADRVPSFDRRLRDAADLSLVERLATQMVER
jgi:photosystem II stability/assembly factor-like uncharacterized protein